MNVRLLSYLTFDPDTFKWADEAEMMDRIWSFHTISIKEEMTREYFDELVWLLVSQMDSEYVGAYGYMPIVHIAPQFAAREIKDVPAIVHDEFIHGTRIRDVLNEIGFDADRWVEDHQPEYSFRLAQGEKLPAVRPTKDFRVNIFYYDLVVSENDLKTWINFGLFQFLQDRGAGEQLRDTLDSSFAPWARENGKTMREENKHIMHGDAWMARLFKNYPEFVQQQFDLWLPRSLATFGRPESTRNDLWRKLGLKRRTNEEVLCAFLDRTEEPLGLHAANETIGLKIPTTEEALAMWYEERYLEKL
jgi:1,2-phenylacetyl-CoA epoxidase catalytic subunit